MLRVSRVCAGGVFGVGDRLRRARAARCAAEVVLRRGCFEGWLWLWLWFWVAEWEWEEDGVEEVERRLLEGGVG